jgi:hypothetical protein
MTVEMFAFIYRIGLKIIACNRRKYLAVRIIYLITLRKGAGKSRKYSGKLKNAAVGSLNIFTSLPHNREVFLPPNLPTPLSFSRTGYTGQQSQVCRGLPYVLSGHALYPFKILPCPHSDLFHINLYL